MKMPSILHIFSTHAGRPVLPSLVALFMSMTAVATAGNPEGNNRSPGFQNLLDSVVRIDVWETVYSDGSKRTSRGVGSGVIMTEDGFILTNAHVVSPKAERIRVTLANLERVEADLVGWDHWTDLAVIQLDLTQLKDRSLTFLHAGFGNSKDLYPGQPVFAVGTPNGLTRTVTRGIISNSRRYFEGTLGFGGYETGHFSNWLQTDAAINPGNSGGPLVTEEGAVIGINTRGYMGSNNLGFAVPQSIAESVMHGLMENGDIVRSYVGIKPGPLQDLESFFNLEVNQGMLINSVDVGSPASQAGIRAGDIVLRIDGETVDGRFPEQLPPIRRKIAETPVGETIDFEIKRGESVFNREVTTELLESRVGEEFAFEDWGISVREVSKAIARERQLDNDSGFMVIGTQPAFPAERAELRPGDIILKVNNEELETLNDLQSVYDGYQDQPSKVLLEVSRNHRISLSVLQPE